MRANSYIGAAVNRLEDHRFLTGRGIYAGDLSREDTLHAVVVRSPLAHGFIRGIDCANAKAMPGVHAIITARDIGADIPRIPMRQEPMPELLPFEQPVIAMTGAPTRSICRGSFTGTPFLCHFATTPGCFAT